MCQPKCVYFGTCGGCAFQDLEYAAQLDLKHKFVEEALSSFSRRDSFQIEPVIPSPKPYHYRHMLSLTVKRRNGGLQLGFMKRDSHTFLSVESCPISDERINQFLPQALAKLETLPLKKKFHTSQMTLRIGDNNKVVTSLPSDRGEKLECTVLGKQFSYSVSSFFQNNYSILDSFVQAVRSLLGTPSKTVIASLPRFSAGAAIPDAEIASSALPPRNDVPRGTLFDLYSGVGLFGISLADGYGRVIGIEEGYEAVEQAKQNAKRNEVKNTTFLQGKVETLFPELIPAVKPPLHPVRDKSLISNGVHIIIDPPRIGLKPGVIQCLLTLPIERLVYVSCELSALQRDLTLLQDRFKITRVQPLDLFPQTKHIETIVLLESR